MVQTRAFYNLLRMDASEGEDFRSLSLEALWARIGCDKETFVQFANNCDTPEELTDLLIDEEADYDPFYLAVFELWRRLFPERRSLSIFCDELDHALEGDDDELIQDGLANLLEVLEENTDAGANPKEVFALISEYCAHDLESVLFEYISQVLDGGNQIYSLELIEDFYPYLSEPIWFEWLKLRHSSSTGAELKKFLGKELELDLLLEVIRVLVSQGEPEIFSLAVKKALPLLEEESELEDLMTMLQDYYHRLDQERKENQVKEKWLKRQKGPIRPEDRQVVLSLLDQ